MHFDDLLDKLLGSKLTPEQQVDYACLLLVQAACRGLLNGNPNPNEEHMEVFFKTNNLSEVWEQSYAPKHKFMVATSNMPVSPTKKEIISFLATYLDYDVQAAINKAA